MTLRMPALGLAVIVIANAFALGGAAWNRSGQPESQLAVSERELRVLSAYPPRTENSGVTLRLQWCVGDSTSMAAGMGEGMASEGNCYNRSPDWLTANRLRELGFDLSVPPSDPRAQRYYSHQLARPALFVFELGGNWQDRALEANRAALAAREAVLALTPDSALLQREVRSMRRRVDWIENGMTRLYLIDAGSSLESLRARYPDRSRYAILSGTVKPALRRWSVVPKDSLWIGGEIGRISGENMNVKAAYQDRLDEKTFALTLGIGKRLEPWIITVK